MFDGNITAGGSAAKSARPAPDAMDIEEEEKAGEGAREDLFRVSNAGDKDVF